nr:MAG TPA: hypothetical protein [Caudoviricetes sp.]
MTCISLLKKVNSERGAGTRLYSERVKALGG